MPSFADRIEELREHYGSQDKLAKALSKSTTTIARWCRGERKEVTIDTLLEIADLTQRSVDWVTGRQRIVGGVDVVLFDKLLSIIAGHPGWGTSTPIERLRDATKLYELSRGADLSDQAMYRLLVQLLRNHSNKK